MINNDRLIKAWEIFRDSNPYEICDGREFRAMREPEYCMGQMVEDTIALLKEQEPAKVRHLHGTKVTVHEEIVFTDECENCSSYLLKHWKACPICGKPVKWE